MCARVRTVAGKSSGALPGSSPGHDAAAVLVQCYDVRSGRPVPTHTAVDRPEDRGYVMIAQPPWYTPSMRHAAETIA